MTNKKTVDGQPYVLVFGMSICDIFGFVNNNYRTHDSNPGKVRMAYGGVCRNIAENMARIEIPTKFITVLGDDENGKGMMLNAEMHGLDMSNALIVEGGTTPTYMAIIDEKGEMVSAVVDTSLVSEVTLDFVDTKEAIIEGSEYMVFGADEVEVIDYTVKKYRGKTKFILDPVSAAKAKCISYLLPYFNTIKPNRHEAEALWGQKINSLEALRKAGSYFRGLGIENVFISLDADGIYYNNEEGEGIIKACDVDVVNVTGAGDAFVAGICHGYMTKQSIQETVKFAICMSTITISHEQTIHPDMNLELLETYMNRIKWEYINFR